jgi:glycosyltransferase involved in cell wall biosynthesis
VELWVVGDGPELSSLVHLVSELNLSESVQFLGAKSKPEIAALMRQSHVFVLTSLWDSSPVVIIEALASGLPVVATDVGGIPELVKPFCGRLVSPADVDEISEGIGHVVNHLAEYSQSRITAYAQREFSLLSVGKRYSDVYQEILGKRLSR